MKKNRILVLEPSSFPSGWRNGLLNAGFQFVPESRVSFPEEYDLIIVQGDDSDSPNFPEKISKVSRGKSILAIVSNEKAGDLAAKAGCHYHTGFIASGKIYFSALIVNILSR